MKVDVKKRIKNVYDNLNKELLWHKKCIDLSTKNNDADEVQKHQNQIKDLQAVDMKEVKHAFKIFASNNRSRITNYLKNDFAKLPLITQQFIFYESTDLAVDGESIYNDSSIDVMKMFRDEDDCVPIIENLFKNKFSCGDFGVLFDKWLDIKSRAYIYYYSNPEDMLKDLTEFSNITYTPKGETEQKMYMPEECLKKLVDKYKVDQYQSKRYTLENLRDFRSKLENAVAQSPNLQKCNILDDFRTYSEFVQGQHAYENYKELLRYPEIKKLFYDKTYDPSGYYLQNNGIPFLINFNILDSFSEEERLVAISEYMSDPLYDKQNRGNRNLGVYIHRYIEDKSLLLDFDTTLPIFENLIIAGYPIAGCFLNHKETLIVGKFLQQETDFIGMDSGALLIRGMSPESEEKLKTVALDYDKYGVIDNQTYEDVLAIGQKYNKNLTIEKLKETIVKNDNLKAVVKYIASNFQEPYMYEQNEQYPPECTSPYRRALYDFETIFPKTRLQALPEIEAYKKMSLEQKSKFNVKVWNQFAQLPIFSKDDNTKRALVEFIAVMGLFEDDADAPKRRQEAYRIATDYGEKIEEKDFNSYLLYNIHSKFLDQLPKAYQEEVDAVKSQGSYSLYEMYRSISEEAKQYIKDKYFAPCKVKVVKQRPGVTIPDDIKPIFDYEDLTISEHFLSTIKKLDGSFGKKIGDFLSPYAKDGEVYKLKRNVHIPEDLVEFLPQNIPEQEYDEILRLAEIENLFDFYKEAEKSSSKIVKKLEATLNQWTYLSEIADFINPIKETVEDGIMPREDIPRADREKIQDVILSSFIIGGRLNFASVHRMFDGCKQQFDPEFYEFLTNNFGLILDNSKTQSKVKVMQANLQKAKTYYAARGNSNPTYFDILTYLNNVTFNYDFGMNEFAQEVKNAGVGLQTTYDFYQSLLPIMQGRKLTTIPRHQKTYEYVDSSGKKYTVMTKILRLDDPATMLVGESKFTNCCQVYHNAGQKCMEHATISKNGGIFATYLVDEKGVPKMLTQSWIWTRESKLCLDNVEATALITGKCGDECRLYQDIATYGIIEASKDLIENSRKGVENYIAAQTVKINKDASLTKEQKKQKFAQLEEFRQRQTLKIITVGEGCDDLHVAETFKQREKPELSQGPKKYDGYRDSGLFGENLSKSKQHIIIKTKDEILPVDEDYEDVAFYRDERRIVSQKGEKITHSLLKHITDIENAAHKKEMVNYTEDDKPILVDEAKLAEIYECSPSEISILAGEDWYYVYSDKGNKIEIYDLARREPRLEDELADQQSEMALAFNTILAQSIVTKDGKPIRAKEIEAELREDTSYLLYLFQKNKGAIAQVAGDVRYKYEKQDKKETFTEEQQKELIKNIRQLRADNNQDLYMHKVGFVATEKTIQKIIENKLSTLDERSL